MDSLGEKLRRSREERGLTLEELAARTRINAKYLEAIERGDRSSTPGGFFYKSFVRQYASTVGGDSTLVDEIEKLLAADEPVAPPIPDEEILKALAAKPAEQTKAARSLPLSAWVAILIVAVAGSAVLFKYLHRTEQAQAAGEAPSQQTEPKQTEPKQTAPKQIAEKSSPPEQPPTQAPAQTPVSTPVSAQAQDPAPPNETRLAGPDDRIVIEVAATELTWFQVWEDGKSVFADALQSGQSKTFAAKANARMKIGNAGGVAVKVNGKPIGLIGPHGQIRNVVFTPTGAEVLKPQPDENQG